MKQNSKDSNKMQKKIDSYAFIKKIQKKNESDLSVKSSEQQNSKSKKILYNVQFYMNERKSDPNGDFIVNIHKNWWGNYSLLQTHHGYIQWLFPNAFTSRFNPNSFALTEQQCNHFRNNVEISTRYIKSYQLILDFFGMKLKSKLSGQITTPRNSSQPYQKRFYLTLITSFHNHMRITRILASLCMIGLGRYAKQLSKFLQKQIHSENGNLRQLAKYNVDKDWKQYLNYQEKGQINVFLRQFQKKPLKQSKQQQKINNLQSQNHSIIIHQIQRAKTTKDDKRTK